MSKRQSIITFDSTEVQGEGSWAKVRLVTHGEQKQITKEYGGLAGKEIKDIGVDNLMELQRANDALLTRNIIEWNWVDDDDISLPIPSADPDVLDRLTELEHQFLASTLKGDAERKK